MQTLLALILLSGVVTDGKPEPLDVEARMRHYGIQAASIAIVDGGRLAGTAAFGATTDTPFQAASLSKPVTALAVLRLAELGKVDLHADVNRYLKRWRVKGDAPVTLAQLLSHTAGTTVAGFPGYAPGTELPAIVDILEGRPPANSPPVLVAVPPGTEQNYSGGGYVIVQLVIEDVTGQSFEAAMQDLVLRPLGMSHSTFIQRAAEGHHLYPELAAAGLWTTPADLARVILHLQRGSPMLTPWFDDAGLGIFLAGDGAERRFVHEGSNRGYQSLLYGFVEGGRGAVIMTEGGRAGAFLREALRGIAHERGWPAPKPKAAISLPPDELRAYAGTYVWPSGKTTTVSFKDGRLWTATEGEKNELRLHARAKDVFFIEEDIPTYTFLRDANGKVEAMLFGRGEVRRYLRRRGQGAGGGAQ